MKPFYNYEQHSSLDYNQIILNAVQALEQNSVNRNSSYNEALKQALHLTDHFTRLSHRQDYEELLSQTVANLNYKFYKAGTPLYHQGSKGNRIFFILTGSVALFQLKSQDEVQHELHWAQKQHSKQINIKNSNDRIRGISEIRDSYTSKFDEELIKKNAKNELHYFRQYSEQGYICKLKRSHTLQKLQSFGIISPQISHYEHTSIAESDSIICYTYINKYDKKFQELFGHIESSINYMSQIFPQLSYEELKQICYNVQIKQYSYQDIIYKENDQNNCFYIIKSGLIDIYKENISSIKDNSVTDSKHINITKSFDQQTNSLSHISQIQDQERVHIKTLNEGEIFGNEDFFKGNYRYFKTVCSSVNAELYEISLQQVFRDSKQSINVQKEFRRKSLIQLTEFMKKLSSKLEELGLSTEASICNMDISISSPSPLSKIQNSLSKRRTTNRCQSQIDFSNIFNTHKRRNESNHFDNSETTGSLCSPELSPIKKNSSYIHESPNFSKGVSFKEQSLNLNSSILPAISTQETLKNSKLDISLIKSQIKLRSFLSQNKADACPEESLNFSRNSNINNISQLHSVNKSQDMTKQRSIQLLDAQFFRDRQKQQSCIIGQQDNDKSILSPTKLQLNNSFFRNRTRQISQLVSSQQNEKSLLNISPQHQQEGKVQQQDIINKIKGNENFLINFRVQSPKKSSTSFLKFQLEPYTEYKTKIQLQKSPLQNEKDKVKHQSPKFKLYDRISQKLQNNNAPYKMMNLFKKQID